LAKKTITKKSVGKSGGKPARQGPPVPSIAGRNYVATKAGMRRTAQGNPVGTINATGAQNAQAISMSPLFYDYRYSTPDKFYFPRDRAQANSIWRDMYRRDATIAIATDMYSDMPWSGFDIEGIDDGSIRKVYEDMFNTLNLVPKLPSFTKDFFITGEFIPHTIFNSTKGFWERVISHNPDYVRVRGLGLAIEQPLLWLKPTPEMRTLTTSADPRVRRFLEVLPRELVTAIRMNRELPLDPINTAYIPRLNTSNDPRGTSIYTRLYRATMYEDFVVNSSLAVSQRNAAPIRLFKLGDPNGTWMPTEDDITQFANLLSLAETDPLSVIITHPFVSVDYVGVADRALLISKEWDFIERIKLLALGISKAFLTGEVSFACFEKGTPVIRSDGTPTPIEDIQTGDLVLDKEGKARRVTNNWCEGVPDKLIEVTVWGGRKFRVTPNHRFPAWMWPTECACGCGGKIKKAGRAFVDQKHACKLSRHHYNSVASPAMVHAGRHRLTQLPKGYEPNRIVDARELRRGDFLKVPKTRDTTVIDPNLNADMARLLGYYLAEGCIGYGVNQKGRTGPSNITLTFGVHEKETFVEDAKRLCHNLGFNCTVAQYRCNGKQKNSITVRVLPKDKSILLWVLKHAGERSHGKCLSEEALRWPSELLMEVLRGYIRGDGCRSDQPTPSQRKNRHAKTKATVQMGTVSEKLASQLILILARLGFPAGHAVAKVKPPRKPYHILRIQGKAAIELCDLVWSEKLNAKANRCSVWQDDEYMYLPIKSVREVSNSEPVYNLTVEGTHTYLVCDGVATCNSAIAGLQVLMERLNTLRHRFEKDWIIPKLCETVAEMHEFYERPKKDLEHRLRVQNPEVKKLVVPKIKWAKSLEPTQDASILAVWQQLQDKGILSERSLASGAGLDYEVERRNKIEEQEYKEKIAEEYGTAAPAGAPGEAPIPPPPPPPPPAAASKRFKRRGGNGKDDRAIFDMPKPVFVRKLRELDKRNLPPVDPRDAAFLAGAGLH
jgi:intein/homing endonuclease